MKIKAAVVEEQGAPFTIKDDVELAEMQAGTWWLRGFATPTKPCVRVMQ